MTITEYIATISQRFSPKKVLRRVLPGTRNATQIGIKDTGVYNEAEERETRLRIPAYDEFEATYDPNGKYLCSDCKYRVLTDLDPNNALCVRVEGLISLHTGSCDLFTFGNYTADDELLSTYKMISLPEVESLNVLSQSRLTKTQSGYQERPISRAFGCLRCSHGKQAKYTDKQGRRIWCRRWGTHVAPTACCSAHVGTDSISPGDEQ